jgi:hypothetical protein
MEAYTGSTETKAYEFLMNDGDRYTVQATSFDKAYAKFNLLGLDQRDVLSVHEYVPQLSEAE